MAHGLTAFAVAVAVLREPVTADNGVPALDPALESAHKLTLMRELVS